MKNLLGISAMALSAVVLFACSKNDVGSGSGNGNELTRVKVHFAEPASKSVTTPTDGGDGTTKQVDYKKIVLKLTAAQGGGSQEFTSDPGPDGQSAIQKANAHVFQNVIDPRSMEVFINDGEAGNMTLTTAFVESGLAAPLYGKSTTFTDGNDNTKEVTVTPEHRMARIEVSNIKHVDSPDGCLYATLDFQGIMLNNILLQEGGLAQNYTTWDGAAANPAKDAIGQSFMGEVDFPGSGNCYAYNFFPQSGSIETLLLCFNNATPSDPEATLESPERYVLVKGFKVNGEPLTEFEAGKVYRITGLNVEDKYISEEPTGPETVTVTATVEVLEWTLVDTTVDWGE